MNADSTRIDCRCFLMMNSSSCCKDTDWFEWQHFGGSQSAPWMEILMGFMSNYISKFLFEYLKIINKCIANCFFESTALVKKCDHISPNGVIM